MLCAVAQRMQRIIVQNVAGYLISIHICYLPAGRSVLGKTVPEVLSTRPRAVLKTEGTVFPIRTDLGGQITC